MSDQARVPRITKGRRRPPERILLYGVEGVGKSSFAGGMPRPLFLDVDASSDELDVARIGDRHDPQNLPPRDYDELIAALRALRDPVVRGDRMTLAIDTVDKIEADFIHPEVVRRYNATNQKPVSTISEIGFAKGYVLALAVWAEFLRELDVLSSLGWNVILLAHATVSKVDNLGGEDFTTYEPALYTGKNSSAAELLREWAATVLFATFDDRAKRESSKKAAGGIEKVGKGFTSGERLAYAVHQGWCMAKNRTSLPESFPLSWEEYSVRVDAYYRSVLPTTSSDPSTLRRMIESNARQIRGWSDEALAEQAISADTYGAAFASNLAAAGDDLAKLSKILERTNERLAKREESRLRAAESKEGK